MKHGIWFVILAILFGALAPVIPAQTASAQNGPDSDYISPSIAPSDNVSPYQVGAALNNNVIEGGSFDFAPNFNQFYFKNWDCQGKVILEPTYQGWSEYLQAEAPFTLVYLIEEEPGNIQGPISLTEPLRLKSVCSINVIVLNNFS